MSADERRPGEAFCFNCPDHEGCMQGIPCSLVKKVNGVVNPLVIEASKVTTERQIEAGIPDILHHTYRQARAEVLEALAVIDDHMDPDGEMEVTICVRQVTKPKRKPNAG